MQKMDNDGDIVPAPRGGRDLPVISRGGRVRFKKPPDPKAARDKKRAAKQREAEDSAFAQVVEQLRELADEFNLRSPERLLVAARDREVRGASLEAARQALAKDAARQTLAPKRRSIGKVAAEAPGRRVQADLIDFSFNTKGEYKYALVAQDVYTREIETIPLRNKRPGVVDRAMGIALSDLQPKDLRRSQMTVSTDRGKEWEDFAETAEEEGMVYKQKPLTAKNDLAVVDRSIQQVKLDLATKVARRGGYWRDYIGSVEEAYNNRYHSAVFGKPSEVEKNPSQNFDVLKANAQKFDHNRNLYVQRREELKEDGAFRAPIKDGGRSFNPRYGPVQTLGRIEGTIVRNADGRGELLKNVLPVPVGSANSAGRLTDPTIGRKTRLQHLAPQVMETLQRMGGRARLAALRKASPQSVIRDLLKNRLSLKAFLQLFGEIFTVAKGGVVTLKGMEPKSRIGDAAAEATVMEEMRKIEEEERAAEAVMDEMRKIEEEERAAAAAAAPPKRRRLTLIGDDTAGAIIMTEMRRIEDEERAAAEAAWRMR